MGSTTSSVGANAGRARKHNRQMVLDRIRLAGLIGRAELARDSGLSTQAVSNIIADLQNDGLISARGRKSGVRGLPPVQYALNPSGGYAVGIEIRPDAVFAAILDLCGTTVSSTRQKLAAVDLDGVTNTVCAARDAVLAQADVPKTRILGAGIVMPGPFGPTGLTGTGSEFSIFHDVAPDDWFESALGMPVVVENDANAAAVAERLTGVARGFETYAFLYFGRGLGLGIVQNGRLVPGAFGNAGEIGHVPVFSNGQSVTLETVVSRLSVQAHMAEAGQTVESIGALADLYTARDPHLMAWLERAQDPFSDAVTIIENLLDPQSVILGGAMPDGILDHLIAHAALAGRSVSVRPGRETPRLLRGASGRMTGTLGGAALVINHAFTPRIAAVV